MTLSTCRGIDVSEHQVPQDWAAHRRDGVAFGFAKASEGEHSQDSRFARHVSGIVAAQLLPGSYHFAWPNQDPRAEAANYIGAARPYAAVQPLYTHWLDLEAYPDRRNYAGRSAAQIRAWVTTWTAAVRAAFPEQRVGIYTSGDDLAAGHVPDGLPLWYPAYPWGAADYPRAETAAQPRPAGRAVEPRMMSGVSGGSHTGGSAPSNSASTVATARAPSWAKSCRTVVNAGW